MSGLLGQCTQVLMLIAGEPRVPHKVRLPVASVVSGPGTRRDKLT